MAHAKKLNLYAASAIYNQIVYTSFSTLYTMHEALLLKQ
jgi:hypothetical protein